jgi:hypothetical protein
MGIYWRDLLFQLLNGLSTLKHLREQLTNGDFQLTTSEEQERVKHLIAFFEELCRDAKLYTTEAAMPESDLGIVFINFLTALTLTQDQRLTQGPAYAVQHVALDNSTWKTAIRHHSVDQEGPVFKQLNDWIVFLKALLQGHHSTSDRDTLDEIIFRVEKTRGLLEQAI